MKVKARVKALEYLPQWAKCCEEYSAAHAAMGDVVLDLDDFIPAHAVKCKYCGSPRPELKGVMNLTSGRYNLLDMYDLDEGPMEAQ